jgi:hypothetical protein
MIGYLLHILPRKNGNGVVWRELTARAVAERNALCMLPSIKK